MTEPRDEEIASLRQAIAGLVSRQRRARAAGRAARAGAQRAGSRRGGAIARAHGPPRGGGHDRSHRRRWRARRALRHPAAGCLDARGRRTPRRRVRIRSPDPRRAPARPALSTISMTVAQVPAQLATTSPTHSKPASKPPRQRCPRGIATRSDGRRRDRRGDDHLRQHPEPNGPMRKRWPACRPWRPRSSGSTSRPPRSSSRRLASGARRRRGPCPTLRVDWASRAMPHRKCARRSGLPSTIWRWRSAGGLICRRARPCARPERVDDPVVGLDAVPSDESRFVLGSGMFIDGGVYGAK